MLFIHGFAGSGLMFFKILNSLCKDFVLIMIDLVGMGGSSRPANFDKHMKDPQKAIDYFVDYVEAWRVAMNNLTNFYLVGHSFGGYVVGNYILKHHQHVKKAILVSPVGIWPAPKGSDPFDEFMKKCEQSTKHGIKPPSIVTLSAMKLMWAQKMSPFAFARIVGQRNLKNMIDGYLDRR